MKLSRNWLNEFVPGVSVRDMDDRAFAEAMTLSGSKVELYGTEGAEIENVVAARLISLERHPNSDHMWICQVDAGKASPVQIVTGAQNLKAGDWVPAALDGSYLPGGTHIVSGELRGVRSDGMLCSLRELGLTAHDFPYAIEDGIFVLSDDPDLRDTLTAGQDIREAIGLNDHVVEFEITPNRSDCLSVIGLAREAAVTFSKPLELHTPEVKGVGGSAADMVRIDIEDPALCSRYTARMVKNVKIAPSPLWMRQRIRAAGMRPINNIVDITNYVMLEYGQPMHAFDFSCVEGEHIIVRPAREGESIRTLDGSDRPLKPGMLCICDEHRPVCVAGVMGGENSEIVGDTAVVLFESANFDGTSVRRTAAALNMRTDSSSRFEKGLDPCQTLAAVNRACELVELLGAGEVVDGVVDVFPRKPKPLRVPLNAEKVNYILGTDIPYETMESILRRLCFDVTDGVITVPSFRRDFSPTHTDNDVAEEVARIYGFNNIPSTLMEESGTTQGGYSTEQKAEAALGSVCRSFGFDEIITYSFYSPAGWDMIRLPEDSPLRDAIRILNPLGEDTSCMRTTTLPSMLETLSRNRSVRRSGVRLYDFGRVYFRREDGLADEPKMLTLGAFGEGMDFFSLKGIIEQLLAALRIENAEYKAVRDNPSYHPGRCAEVSANGRKIGVFGQIHPLAAKNYGVSDELWCAELSLSAMLAEAKTEVFYTPLPRFPSVERDIAVVCAEEITAGELLRCIRENGGEYLRSAEVFDVYRGAGIPEGKKSVAVSLTLRADDQTLTDEHADGAVSGILAALGEAFGAVIR